MALVDSASLEGAQYGMDSEASWTGDASEDLEAQAVFEGIRIDFPGARASERSHTG